MEEWLRGEGSYSSRLYRPEDGKKCCVGFFALAKGIPLDKIWNINEYANIGYGPDPFLKAGIYDTNDNQNTTDESKIKNLTEQFKKLGHEIEFIRKEETNGKPTREISSRTQKGTTSRQKE